METSNDCFVATLQKKLKDQGRGAKKEFAASVGISPNHLSDILSRRKNAGQKLKERSAYALDMSFEDMLVYGRHIVAGKRDKAKNNTARSGLDQGFVEGPEKESFKIPDYMVMTAKVIESDTLFSQILINNITACYQALEFAQNEKKTFQMIHNLQEKLTLMRQDVEKLK